MSRREALKLGAVGAALGLILGPSPTEAASVPANKLGLDYISLANMQLKEEAASRLALRDLTDSAYVDLIMKNLFAMGNVGIGTTTPSYQLEIAGGTSVAGIKFVSTNWGAIPNPGSIADSVVANPRGYNFAMDSQTLSSAYQPTMGIGIAVSRANPALAIKNAGGPSILVESGNVGIGTTSPNSSLSLGTALGNKIFLYDNAPSDTYGFGIQGHTLQIFAGAGDLANNRIAFGYGNSTSFNEVMRIMASGNVGIGTPSPGYRLDVAGACHASSFPTSSDIRFKESVKQLKNVLERLEKLDGVTFRWNRRYESLGRSTGHEEVGIIAQQIEKVFPELVTTWGEEKYRAIDYGRFSAVLLEGIKELSRRVQTLEEKVNLQLMQSQTSPT